MQFASVHYDCDPGQDDAIALLYALGSSILDIKSISVVGGNTDVRQCARNALQLLELAGRDDIPVYIGAEKPLVRPLHTLPEVFGASGMAGAEDLPEPAQPVKRGHGADVIAALPAGTTLIATGPLTNLALALQKNPQLPSRIPHLVIMGGCVFPEPIGGRMGNFPVAGSDDVAEYNFALDPEAAKAVFAAGFPAITLIGLNLTRAVLYNHHVDKAFRGCGSRAGIKAAEILSTIGAEDEEDYKDVKEFAADPVRAMHDVLAMVAAARPDLFSFEISPVQIVCAPPPAASGQSLPVLDGYDHPGVKVATAANTKGVMEELVRALATLP